MTQEEILKEIGRLPRRERQALYARFSKAIRYGDDHVKNFDEDRFRVNLSREDRRAIAKSLSGTFKPEGRYMPLTKEEDREIILEYLEEKYS